MRIVAVINQKGGVGKTTTVANLGAALAAVGRDVCLIDLDPQAHLTLHLGLEPGAAQTSIYEMLTAEAALGAAAQSIAPHLWIVPSVIDLAAAEVELAGTVGREQVLRDRLRAGPGANSGAPASVGPSPSASTPAVPLAPAQSPAPVDASATPSPPAASPAVLQDVVGATAPESASAAPQAPGDAPLSPDRCDFVLIDCPPSLGLLTLNALAAADDVLIPLQPHFLALQGMGKLLETASLVQRRINPNLRIRGVVLCLYETGTKLAAEVVADLQKFFTASRDAAAPWADARIFQTAIRRNVKLAESPSHGKTIFDYDPRSRGAEDYRALAEEFLALYAPAAGPAASQEAGRDKGDTRDSREALQASPDVPAPESVLPTMPSSPQQTTV